MIVLEEAAAIDQDVYYEVIVPLLGVAHACCIAISTPVAGVDFYNEMEAVTLPSSTGEPRQLFKIIKIGLICKACAADATGKNDVAALVCPHKLPTVEQLPRWKSVRKHMATQAIYGGAHAETMMQEALGASAGLKDGAFSKNLLVFLEQSSFVIPSDRDVERIFVGVDPAGGGSSAMAIVSYVVTSGGHYVARLRSS